MAAVTDYRPTRKVQQAKRIGWSAEKSAVHGDLCYWGSRYTRILLSEGFAPFSPFAVVLEGYAPDFGSKVLYPDMTERAWEINMRLWSIRPLEYVWAIVGRYALPIRDDDGGDITPARIAGALGCTVESYYKRVSRGRSEYQKRLFS